MVYKIRVYLRAHILAAAAAAAGSSGRAGAQHAAVSAEQHRRLAAAAGGGQALCVRVEMHLPPGISLERSGRRGLAHGHLCKQTDSAHHLLSTAQQVKRNDMWWSTA